MNNHKAACESLAKAYADSIHLFSEEFTEFMLLRAFYFLWLRDNPNGEA